MTSIDSKDAASALKDINEVARRVRQSRTYDLTSLMLIMWGVLVFAGHLVEHVLPRSALWNWLAVTVLGIAGSFAISAVTRARTGVRTFDARFFTAFVLFLGFGYIWTFGVGQFTPRQLGTFWPSRAFVVIGLGVTALTLIGYFFIGYWFHLWMAVVNGGGLILGGLWMRRS